MENILKKIHSLYTLSTNAGATMPESLLAKERYEYLLAKYELSLQDILQYQSNHIEYHKDVLFVRERLRTWDKYIMQLLQEFYHVAIVQQRVTYEYILVGTSNHILLAKEVYHYLEKVFPQAFKKYKQIHIRTQSNSFYYGIYSSLYSRLQQYHHDLNYTTAIALHMESLQQYLAKEYGRSIKKTSRINITDKMSFLHGERYGSQIELTLSQHQKKLS